MLVIIVGLFVTNCQAVVTPNSLILINCLNTSKVRSGSLVSSLCGRGRKPTSQTVGPVQPRNGLHNFFTSLVPPLSQTIATRTRATTRLRNTIAGKTAASESNNEQPVNTPNFDADDSGFDDSVLHKGKKLSGENLSKQVKKIMNTVYKDNAYKNVEHNGILWDIPPSLVVNPKHSMKNSGSIFSSLEFSIGLQKPCWGKIGDQIVHIVGIHYSIIF